MYRMFINSSNCLSGFSFTFRFRKKGLCSGTLGQRLIAVAAVRLAAASGDEEQNY